ncbi:MAG: hypothetical protein ACTHLY_01475 [Pseudolabrys sp.]
MTDQPAPIQKDRSSLIFKLLCAYLILTFLWRAFVPAHEYPSRHAMILDMVVDGAAIVSLIGLRTKGPVALFWIAVIAGLCLFAIRFTSNASWWTGHLMYSLR